MRRYVNSQDSDMELPSQAHWALAEAYAELRLHNLREARDYSQSLRALQHEYLEKLHALIGEDRLEQYLQLHNERLENMKKARRELQPTAEGIEKLHRLREYAVQKSKELIDGSGVNVNELQKLQREYAMRAAALSQPGEGPNIGAGVEYRTNHTYRPPYMGEDADCFGDHTRGTVTYSAWTDRLTGEAGAHSTIDIRDADDSDTAFATCRPRMRIVYTMETPGPLTIRVQLETIDDTVNGAYDQECGYSEFDWKQQLVVYAQRTWPDPPSALIYRELPGGSCYHRAKSGSSMGMLAYIGGFMDPGDISEVSLTLPVRPGAGSHEMMGIDVGIELRNECWVNDVTLQSSMNNNYIIREIRVLE